MCIGLEWLKQSPVTKLLGGKQRAGLESSLSGSFSFLLVSSPANGPPDGTPPGRHLPSAEERINDQYETASCFSTSRHAFSTCRSIGKSSLLMCVRPSFSKDKIPLIFFSSVHVKYSLILRCLKEKCNPFFISVVSQRG